MPRYFFRPLGLSLAALLLAGRALAQGGVTSPVGTQPAQQPAAASAQEPTHHEHDAASNWSVHFQQTIIQQWHNDLSPRYAGPFSLQAREQAKLSLTTTAFIGRKLWRGAAVYFNPEVAGGSGLSGATGIGGAPNGETFRIGDPAPQVYLARLYLRQLWALGSETTNFEDDINQVSGARPTRYLALNVGKFSMADYFDQNSYSHDPRTQFFNWSLMSAGSWDYPANVRGYTAGAVLEYVTPTYALRAGLGAMPTDANGPTLDLHYGKAQALTVELTKPYTLGGHPGTVRLLGFRNQAAMGSYTLAVRNAGPAGPDVTAVRADRRTKYGFVVNAEQEISPNVGLFGRFSYNDGHNETWAFTEIDRSLSVGLTSTGARWKRPTDRLGVAAVANGLSKDHQNYLAAGGSGFILGDGRLDYGLEYIGEVYYSIDFPRYHAALSPDYQIIFNPGYNTSRLPGPVHVVALRVHVEF
ncbi:carbohydrate porin [Hymenobacter sp. H14-R3]|uniref:carbohydrate porin n=1 Tax=Hymenobacter sp. H14-R3 TaxID=3046308 RepID=UPI0024B95361|nr:carbohydrate porin [Hymenobacter sp. H14-R3]MDJ0364338.1 carbohydrate porin [Hymenobacter sp. H14-R3]